MKIYTKTGDRGKTGLFGGDRIKKNHLRIETYGTIDELNSVLGIAISNSKNKKLKTMLIYLQNELFQLGSDLATLLGSKFEDKISRIGQKHIEIIENWIDELNKELPEFNRFILPGGGFVAAHLHLARTVCRRAERTCVSLLEEVEINEHIQPYLNRLSDFLFIAARYANFSEDISDIFVKREEN
jgi:cob(I)alamin adenosyltransferase